MLWFMNIRMVARGLAWDVGLPVVTYYALHLLGVSNWVALLASTSVAAARIVRDRSLNPFAAVMLIVFGLGLLLSFVSGDPRFLLVKESFVTGAIGLTFLVTAAVGRRPLTLAAQQSWEPADAAELMREYRANPRVRRGHRFSSTVWGAVLLAEAAIRVPLVYLLPIDVMVGVSTAMMVAVIAGLVVWNARWVARARSGQVARHQDVVDEAPVEQELVAEDALLHEPAARVEPPSHGVGPEHP
jgi:hypothetical protein